MHYLSQEILELKNKKSQFLTGVLVLTGAWLGVSARTEAWLKGRVEWVTGKAVQGDFSFKEFLSYVKENANDSWL